MNALAQITTILTPTYNKPRQIEEAAEAVFAQSDRRWRWWIVLDGPTAQTRRAVETLAAKDPRIVVFLESTTAAARRERYRPAAILNKFLPLVATGRISWLADDDVWDREFLSTLAGELDEHPDWDAVYCGFRSHLMLRNGNKQHRYDFVDKQDRGRDTGRACWGEVLSINTMFTKRSYEAISPFRIPESWETARQCDHIFMRALEAKFTVHAVPQILVTNRVFACSANTRTDELVEAEFEAGGIAVRQVTTDDLEFLRVLRNRNRQWFFDDREITPQDQATWFDRLATDSRCRFFVVAEQGRPLGTLSLTDRGEAVELGNLLLEEERRGLGIIEYACRVVMKPHVRYIARVKADNQPSRRLLEKLGVDCEIVTSTSDKPLVATSSVCRLSIGAGFQRRPDWTTLDANAEAAPDIVATVPPLPVSVHRTQWDEVELIHFLPKLPLWEAEALLREVYDVLRPQGRLVLEQPNLRTAARILLDHPPGVTSPSDQFHLWGIYGDPSHRDVRMLHRWGYEPASLNALLQRIGFVETNIQERVAQFHVTERDFRMEAVK